MVKSFLLLFHWRRRATLKSGDKIRLSTVNRRAHGGRPAGSSVAGGRMFASCPFTPPPDEDCSFVLIIVIVAP